MSKHKFVAVLLTVMVALSNLSAKNTQHIIKATLYIMESIEPSNVSAAFGIIENLNNFPITLQSITSDISQATELHQSIQNPNGTSQMQKIDSMQIPAKSSLNLSPNGFHIMLIGLKSPLVVGSSAEIRIKFITNTTNTTTQTQFVQPQTIKATVVSRKSLNQHLEHIGANSPNNDSASLEETHTNAH